MFDIYKTIDLEYLGENGEWQGCYLKFSPLTIEDIQKLTGIDPNGDPSKATSLAVEILANRFSEGEAMDGGKKVRVTADQIKEFPVEVILNCIKSMSATVDKKKENISENSSEAEVKTPA